MIAEILAVALMLLAAHWLADYPLQGDFLASAKVQGPLRLYHLIAHAGIQAAGVFLVTQSFALALGEWALHYLIDENKAHGRISFAVDQALHIACKALWLVILFAVWR